MTARIKAVNFLRDSRYEQHPIHRHDICRRRVRDGRWLRSKLKSMSNPPLTFRPDCLPRSSRDFWSWRKKRKATPCVGNEPFAAIAVTRHPALTRHSPFSQAAPSRAPDRLQRYTDTGDGTARWTCSHKSSAGRSRPCASTSPCRHVADVRRPPPLLDLSTAGAGALAACAHPPGAPRPARIVETPQIVCARL
jgi:hypothetical protein